MTLNYSVAVILWVCMLSFVLVLMPLWFYPRSKTLWAAIEFLVARSDPEYHSPVRRDPRVTDLE